jgi:hypothetical protein
VPDIAMIIPLLGAFATLSLLLCGCAAPVSPFHGMLTGLISLTVLIGVPAALVWLHQILQPTLPVTLAGGLITLVSAAAFATLVTHKLIVDGNRWALAVLDCKPAGAPRRRPRSASRGRKEALHVG